MDWAWHVHHLVLLEPLTEPIGIRRQYIRQNKPAEEIEIRLRLLQSVMGKLPVALDEAGKALEEAAKALYEARKSPEVLALHALECPNCPWDGNTIFSEMQK